MKEQAIGAPKEAEAGAEVKGLLRHEGISRDTFCRWRKKHGA